MIKSKLLSLRPIELNDDVILQQLINNPLVSENVVGWTFPVSLFSQKNWIQSNTNNLSYRLAVVDNRTNETIGITGLWDIDWHNQSALSAIKLLPSHKGKGLGTETVMLTMAWAFYSVGLRRLHSTILDFNGPSLGLYIKKCGWKVEGCQREAIFRKGEWHDLYNVAILKREFDTLPAASEFINTICPVDTTPNVDINFQDYI